MTAKKVILTSLKADLDREKKGDWIPFPDWEGVKFNVSALTLPEYETARGLMFQRLQKTYGDAPVPTEVLNAELGQLYAEHILHGWEGLDEEYSPEHALATLSNPEYRVVVQAVGWCAAKISQIEAKYTAAEGGNSSPPSVTG
ncbi:hypothetical protein Rleg9DRAFT_1695 [Rhizobium leguminosarum bv. trifolii WSM597]|uniref:Uncharacterized protein n=1 Tax=Rhizobium leguminosarum bv. trifolii WSM597 TaxID=754764 RepID=I9X2F2_RHILT|nr:hypothetical protein [Rhizobium leguminosarum]EJB02881.1 hypothetical protein Rleg9DRAFT_1695 [Rhizobium leguminosarum bv. trifolii WSM597]